MDRSLYSPASLVPLALVARALNTTGHTPACTARTGSSPATAPAVRQVCTSRNTEEAVMKRSISSRSICAVAESGPERKKSRLRGLSRLPLGHSASVGPPDMCAWTSIRSPTGRDSRSDGGQSSKIPPAAQAQPVGLHQASHRGVGDRVWAWPRGGGPEDHITQVAPDVRLDARGYVCV
jgi:hypothetical protein